MLTYSRHWLKIIGLTETNVEKKCLEKQIKAYTLFYHWFCTKYMYHRQNGDVYQPMNFVVMYNVLLLRHVEWACPDK